MHLINASAKKQYSSVSKFFIKMLACLMLFYQILVVIVPYGL
jgi:hypothetical protein